MESNTPEQLRIRELESMLEDVKAENSQLRLINVKLGYSTRVLHEFHMSKEDKFDVCDDIENCKDEKEVVKTYDKYHKLFFNEDLEDKYKEYENLDDFQWSQGFEDNLRHYFAVSLGYDIVSEIRESLVIIKNYSALENKIMSTPDSAIRNPMADKLLKDREGMLEALDKIINIINSFN